MPIGNDPATMEIIQFTKKGLNIVSENVVLKLLRWIMENLHENLTYARTHSELKNANELKQVVEEESKRTGIQQDIHTFDGMDATSVAVYEDAFRKAGMMFSCEYNKQTGLFDVAFNIPNKGHEQAIMSMLQKAEGLIVNQNKMTLTQKIIEATKRQEQQTRAVLETEINLPFGQRKTAQDTQEATAEPGGR